MIYDIPKCSHCTRLLGKPVRHTGPYQGRGDKCLFDTKGIRKPSTCVRSEHNGEIKDIPGESKRMTTEALDGRLEYTDTPNCVYIHSIFNESSDFSQGYGASRGRAQNKSRQYLYKKVEKTPYRAEERRIEEAMHNKKHKNYMKNVSPDVTSQDVTLKIQEEEIIDRESKNEINENVHRDENLDLMDKNLVNPDSVNIFTLNESHRDDKIFKKPKYIKWQPYFYFKFLNPNTPIHHRYGTMLLDSGAFNSVIHISKLPYCRILKRERRQQTKAFGAGGNAIPLADFTVDIAMEIDILGVFILKKVLVSTSQNITTQFLLGASDMNRLKVGIDFKRKRVQFGVGPNRGKWIKMHKPEMLHAILLCNNKIHRQHTRCK